MHIKNDGRIGVETTTPLSKFHIVGHVSESHSGSLFLVEGSSGSLFEVTDSLSGSLMSVNDVSGLPILEVFDDDRVVMGTYAQNTLVVTGSKVGMGTSTPSNTLTIAHSSGDSFSLYDTGTVSYLQSHTNPIYLDSVSDIRIHAQASGGDIYLDANGFIKFREAGADIMTIDGGFVGIGATGPAVPLHVYNTGELVRLADSNAAGSPYLSFYQTTTRRAYIQYHDASDALLLAAEYGPMRFYTGVGGTETEKMRINADGKVGIGTDSPTATLHVSGSTWDDVLHLQGAADTGMVLYHGNGTKFGSFYGTTGQIGILDGDNSWAIQHTTDTSTIFNTNNTQRMIISSSGYVGIGTASPQYTLDLYDTTATNGGLNVRGSNQRIYFSGHRALEGATDGSNLSVGEGYTTIYNKTDTVIQGNISSSGYVRIDGTAIDPATSESVNLGVDTFGSLQIYTDNGYVRIGPTNTSYCHFYTDRAAYYFDTKIEVADHIHPYANDSYDLGSTTKYWRDLYVRNLFVSESTSIAGNIIPLVDDTYTLGDATHRWSDIFATQTTTGGIFEVGLRTEEISELPTGTLVV